LIFTCVALTLIEVSPLPGQVVTPGSEKTLKGHDWSELRLPTHAINYTFEISHAALDLVTKPKSTKEQMDRQESIRDSQGVVMLRLGGNLHYHPLAISRQCMRLLDVFQATGDTVWMVALRKHIKRLLDDACRTNGALYMTYSFDYNVHHNPGWHLTAPWYSGMAQGAALALFTRLWTVTATRHIGVLPIAYLGLW